MAASLGESAPRASADFIESSVLEAIVPARSDVDIEEEFQSWDGATEDEAGSIAPFVSQRNVLLLGMLAGEGLGATSSLTHALGR